MRRAPLLALGAEPADGGGVKQHVGPLERGEAGRFGIPLIPADEHTQLGKTRVKHLITAIAGGEIELLVKMGVFGNVVFAVFAQQSAVGVHHHRRVVIETLGAFFKQAGHQHHAQFRRQFLQVIGGGARNGLGQSERFVVVTLAKITAQKEFLRDDDLGPRSGSLTNERLAVALVQRRVFGAGVLQQGQCERLHGSGRITGEA